VVGKNGALVTARGRAVPLESKGAGLDTRNPVDQPMSIGM
jgi:hypothetical protein